MTAAHPLPAVRCALAAVSAGAWIWAVWRTAVGEVGPLESSVAAGGWGLALLPVHVSRRGGAGRERAYRWEPRLRGRAGHGSGPRRRRGG
ncbi:MULTISPECIES: hypothetical protein [Streptomyces]|uniref:Uncharacterized protein n=2 Tax=Streptomyces cacaoi TaxID=1898 RepID=A0A4Y3QXJ8_STRCI|nr:MULTISPECIES: hypothetical protein [Streptomyces]GEB49942.1 hypothetical protein SCA03_24930 [Streptomyces cacaoi]